MLDYCGLYPARRVKNVVHLKDMILIINDLDSEIVIFENNLLAFLKKESPAARPTVLLLPLPAYKLLLLLFLLLLLMLILLLLMLLR